MKSKIIFRYIIVFVCFAILFLNNCKKDYKEPPSGKSSFLITAEANNISSTYATFEGKIITNPNLNIVSLGFVWSTLELPTIENNEGISVDTTKTDVLTYNAIYLMPNTKYYVRVYAVSNLGVNYGNQVSFNTKLLSIGDNYAGGIVAYIFQLEDPGYDNNKQKGLIISPHNQSGDIEWGCYGTNISGTSEGLGSGATNTNIIVSGCSGSHAAQLCNDLVLNSYNDWYLPSKVELELINRNKQLIGGLSYARYWSSSQYNKDNALMIDFSDNKLYHSDKNNKYYVRAVRTFGIGNDNLTSIPVITTNPIANITQISATSGGNVVSDGGAIIINRGVCWSTSENPTIANSKTSNGTGIGSFTSNITGLNSNTTYYVRAYAINSNGTFYGGQIGFSTTSFPNCGQMNDIDGNTYNTIIIGTQCWFKDNLKTTKYRNGSSIIHPGNNNASWENNTDGAYSWYNNNYSFKDTYGALYNWYAVNNNNQLCPAGWRVPNFSDWEILINYLGGSNIAGGKMKEAGITYWNEPNTNATNESGFSGIAGGLRSYHGVDFYNMGYSGSWWSTTQYNDQWMSSSWSLKLTYNNSNASLNYTSKKQGFSVRCIKN